jgi:integrase
VKVVGVGKTNPAGHRDPYSPEQLSAIFASPLYTGHAEHARHAAGKWLIKDARYWAPLIALLAGMRTQEILQLHVADLRQEKGIWVFEISEGEEKKLKTPASARRVPVHAFLLQLGILDLTSVPKKQVRLFPEIEPGPNGDFSNNFSKWWGRYARHIGFWKPKTVFHSFRHNFLDALRAAELPDYVNKALMGHSDQTVHSHYGSGPPLSLLKAAVDKVQYDVDLKVLLAQHTPSS